MTIEEFKEIYNHVINNSYGYYIEESGKFAEVYGTWNGGKVTARGENFGLDRYLIIDGKKYHAVYNNGEWEKSVYVDKN